jgi:hypothetical protein
MTVQVARRQALPGQCLLFDLPQRRLALGFPRDMNRRASVTLESEHYALLDRRADRLLADSDDLFRKLESLLIRAEFERWRLNAAFEQNVWQCSVSVDERRVGSDRSRWVGCELGW